MIYDSGIMEIVYEIWNRVGPPGKSITCMEGACIKSAVKSVVLLKTWSIRVLCQSS